MTSPLLSTGDHDDSHTCLLTSGVLFNTASSSEQTEFILENASFGGGGEVQVKQQNAFIDIVENS